MEYIGPIRYPPSEERGRDIVVVLVSGERQPFYRSTGRNSGMPGEWFPFDGVSVAEGSPWFAKDRYICAERGHPLYRRGNAQLAAIGRELREMNIPVGEYVYHPRDVNLFLDTHESLRNNELILYYEGMGIDFSEPKQLPQGV